ncbi:MAG: hypothetical protein NT030_03235 [Candidatus Saganbacteria bacterium]|nr:hypothetical protein [Candidatus Saganbacteria bacterium]
MNFREFKAKVKNLPFFGSDVAEIFSLTPAALRNQLARWKKRGWLVELRRGLYTLGLSEKEASLSREVAAANIYQPSYLSLEFALSSYKLIPEKVAAATSVTTRKTKVFHNQAGAFIYRQLKPSLYFGFIAKKDEAGYPYFIAEPEKALLDYLYLNLGTIKEQDKDYFTGSLRLQNRSRLDKKKLILYSRRFGLKKLTRVLEHLK